MEKRRKYDKVLFYCLHLITRFYREKKKILLINCFCHCLCEHEHEVALVVYVIPRTNSLLSPLNDWSVIMCTHHYTIRVYVWECVTCSVLFFFRSCYCWCCCCCCIWISCGDRSVWFNEQYKWWSGAHTGGFANIVRFKSIQLTADHRRVNCLILVRCFGPVSPCFVRNLHLELIDWM